VLELAVAVVVAAAVLLLHKLVAALEYMGKAQMV
jgi:hypothetical protein